MLKVFIDPGHGGADRANRGPTGYVEADGVLDIGLRVRSFIEKHVTVAMSRTTDTTVPLYNRPAMANDWGADLFVSIHTNAAADPRANGIETFHSKMSEWGGKFEPEAARLAVEVQTELVEATKLNDRGIKTRLVTRSDSPILGMDWYAVIRRAKCPAIIVEVGFHTNLSDEKLLKSPGFRQCAAEAIAKGIMKYAGVKDVAKAENAGPFPDVPAKHWAAGAIRFVAERGIMSGFKDGSFKPNEPVTRAQMAAILRRMDQRLQGG